VKDAQLISGAPVPEDRSHTKLRPNGLQQDYVVLTPEERAKGYKKPVRRSYLHLLCRTVTTMHSALAETYARDPYFYSGTFCSTCQKHYDLEQFTWEPDGEPMDPLKQDDWAKAQVNAKAERILAAAAELEKKERAEYERLKAKYG
jgi:hypothetical protein